MEIVTESIAFNGDTHLEEKTKELVNSFGIDTIIETGTYMGDTTRFFSQIVPDVFTIEISDTYYKKAEAGFKGYKNVKRFLGSSPDMLRLILGMLDHKFDKTLFFLDAHWNSFNPLLAELEAIAFFKLKPVIMIHDFRNPGDPTMGFDTYGGQDYEWSWIEKHIEAIYGKDGYRYYYNTEAVGARRGVVIIEPK
jgi:predicted O-methyltransferase YrrM